MTQDGNSARLVQVSVHIGSQRLAGSLKEVNSDQLIVSLQSNALTAVNDNQPVILEVQLPEGSSEELGCDLLRRTAHQLVLRPRSPNAPLMNRLINQLKNALPGQPANIDELNRIAADHLSERMDHFLTELDHQLLKMADHSPIGQQARLMEVRNQFIEKGSQIKRQLINTVCQTRSDAQHDEHEHLASSHDEMELLDLEEFEEWLSVEKIIRRAEHKFQNPLANLERRMAALSQQSHRNLSLNLSVDHLCHVFQDTLKDSGFSNEMLPIAYRLFDQTVVDNLGRLYDRLNFRLKEQGILPNAESELIRQPKAASKSTLEMYSRPDSLPNEADLYESVMRVLQLSADQPQGQVESPLSVDDVITGLSALTSAEHRDDRPLHQRLVQEVGLNPPAKFRENLTLVDNIFSNAKSSLNRWPELQDLVNQLEIPVAKVALNDLNFFVADQHPTRQILNLMVQLGLNSDAPNLALERKLNTIISTIVENGATEKNCTNAISQLNTLIAQQQSAFRRNAERIAQNYQGRQRVTQAEQAVLRELGKRVSANHAPQVVIQLLNQGWKELLQLTHIKHGPESSQWHEQLDLLESLMELLEDCHQIDDSGQFCTLNYEQQLKADTLVDRCEHLLDDNFPGQFRHQQVMETMRSVLSGKMAVEFTTTDMLDSDTEDTPVIDQLSAAHPELNRWLKRAATLKVGDEFGYLDDESGDRDIKLAWVSENHNHFVFVNRRGQKVLDLDQLDVANALKSGLTPVTADDNWPLVERSLYTTVQQAYEKLAFKSSHDELTDLNNRKECERRITAAISNAKVRLLNYWLLYIDIDKFGLTNDLHGHLAGDHLLKEIARILIELVPGEAVLGRMGGNEFIALLPTTHSEAALELAEAFRKNIENHKFTWQGQPIELTTSIGLVEINKYTDSDISVLRNAITTCKQAKQSGGNRLLVYEQDATLQLRREKMLSWLNRLNSVLASDRLVLRGQRIYALEEAESIPHYEILIAVREDDNSLSSPSEFIEAVECYNRMQRIDRWVIENVFKWLSELDTNGLIVPFVSINLSGNSINDDQFFDFLLTAFESYQVPTTKICFEVTETATIANLTAAADFIREIKKYGCKFSLDDFGSGNASYQYLKHLPVDYIKIDGTFVQHIEKNQEDYAMVKSINEIAHLLRKKTIAEFTENDQIVQILTEIGVDYAQGWALGHPVPLDQLNVELSGNN